MKVLKINSSFLGEQMQFVSKRQKMYFFDPLIILLGRKQAETSYIVTNLKSGNKQMFNNWLANPELQADKNIMQPFKKIWAKTMTIHYKICLK